jgi:hypothetical protein
MVLANGEHRGRSRARDRERRAQRKSERTLCRYKETEPTNRTCDERREPEGQEAEWRSRPKGTKKMKTR